VRESREGDLRFDFEDEEDFLGRETVLEKGRVLEVGKLRGGVVVARMIR
jgi:hypothetical protein